jgi:hypothetical protein
VADSGYCSEENLKYLNKRKIEGFVTTKKQKHGQRREPCKPGPLPKGASRVEQMERKLQTQAGAAVYATRKFIQISAHSPRTFSNPRKRNCRNPRALFDLPEYRLDNVTHNILKFHKIICSG